MARERERVRVRPEERRVSQKEFSVYVRNLPEEL